tara:strand:- start:98 stop:247 length:150 start_codon:yes stop_codon:yes gene_type:complete
MVITNKKMIPTQEYTPSVEFDREQADKELNSGIYTDEERELIRAFLNRL